MLVSTAKFEENASLDCEYATFESATNFGYRLLLVASAKLEAKVPSALDDGTPDT